MLRLPRQRARRLREPVDLRQWETQAAEELQDLDRDGRGAAHRHLGGVEPEQLEHGMQDLARPARTGERDRRSSVSSRARASAASFPTSSARSNSASLSGSAASSERTIAVHLLVGARHTEEHLRSRVAEVRRRGTGCPRTSSARSRTPRRSSATSCARRCAPSGGRRRGGSPRPTSPSRAGCSRSSSRCWRDRASRPSGRRSCPTCR